MFRLFFIILSLWVVSSVGAFAQETAENAAGEGTTESINQMVNGVRHGHWRIEKKNGKREEGDYVEGEKNGEWVSYAADGKVRSRVTFEMGIAKGKAVYYHDDGSVMESGFWNVDHWEGAYERFYSNGNKAVEFTYNKDGKREGKQVYFHENGNVMYDGNWADGKINGALAIFNEEGKKVMERNYDSSGKFQGAQQVEAPQLEATPGRQFKGSGQYTLFNSLGKIDKQGIFKNGELLTGEKYIYDASGNLIMVEHYKYGKLTRKEKK